MKTVVLDLPCELTHEELRLKIQALVGTMEEREGLEKKLKTIKSDYKDQLDGLSMHIETLSKSIADGTEGRDTECKVVIDSDKKLIAYFRMDANELVRVREVTLQEQQANLLEDEDYDEATEEEIYAINGHLKEHDGLVG